ncbi:MAG: GTPase Era [Thermoanaerobaculaceae bacterium]|nr:GTPase Era [Thermoanaerobaculaceae bacterium]
MNSKKSGFVALFGETNVGKSTLVNTAVGEIVSIVTPKPQTTRTAIKGIYNDERGQIVFVDTPGIHKPKGNLGKMMVRIAYESLEGIDLLILMFDASKPLKIDKRTSKEFENATCPKFIVLNKIDLIKDKRELLPKIEEISNFFKETEIFPISAVNVEDVRKLLDKIFERLPFGEPLYDEEIYSDIMEKQLAAEIVRKHLFMALKQEIPYTTAVYVEKFEEPQNERQKVFISAVILIEKKSHKPIIIGKGGQGIKKIGISSRIELEKILGRKIDLRLFVKVKPDWENDPQILRELGLR